MTERDRYFREISRTFLARRGAPFFLSPQDLELIATWERDGVPLALVLEAIERAFPPAGAADLPRGKPRPLTFCRNQVRRLWDVRRDRLVGAAQTGPAGAGRGGQKSKALAEVDAFLEHVECPLELAALVRRARQELSKAAPDEEALERLDEQADAFLADSAEGRERTRRIKIQRTRLKLPHFALFYY
jgi:hypothetical protein